MRAFTKSVSPALARSRAAWVRAHLEARWKALETRLDAEIASTEIQVQWVGENAGEASATPMTDALAREAGPRASEALAGALATSGLGEDERWALAEGWAEAGRAHARAWIGAGTGEGALKAAVGEMRSISETVPGETPEGVPLGRVREVARRGRKLLDTLKGCERWLAWEACVSVPPEDLGVGPERWRAWLLSQGAGRAVGERTASEALRDWRWPNVRPPMRLAGLGAGHLPPIEGDSAWANAIACEGAAANVPAGERARVWAARARREESTYEARRRADIGAEAIEWMSWRAARTETWQSPKDALARWRAMWRACPHLPGEGVSERLALAERTAGGRRRVVWTTPVTGPEGLICASMLHRERPGALALAAASGTLELILWPEIGKRLGRVRWDRTAVERMTGGRAPGGSEPMAGVLAHIARTHDEIGARDDLGLLGTMIGAGVPTRAATPGYRPDALSRAVMDLAPVVAEIDDWDTRSK